MTADSIAATLESEITAGRIDPGSELIQSELAKRFAVSRIPVRDALQLLAAMGLVTIAPNRGARVIQLTIEEVREVYELRILLECDCLGQAIPNMAPDDHKRIEHTLLKSNLDALGDCWAEGDWLFHATLYEPAGRKRQIEMIRSLRRTCQLHIAAYRKLPEDTARWCEDHVRLTEFCRAGKRQAAAKLLGEHIKAAGKSLISAMSG